MVFRRNALRSLMLKGDGGQSNLDFIFGLGVFLVTFTYAVSFVPGMFAAVQPDAIDLTSVAYRTTAILAEDPGWRIYDGPDGTPAGSEGWEANDISELARVGLAVDKTKPNVLSIDKVVTLNNPTLVNYSVARDKMGLSGSVIYDMNLFVTMNHTVMGEKLDLLSVKSPNYTNFNVESLDRRVMIDTGKQLYVDCYYPSSPDYDLQVDVNDLNPMDKHNVTLRIYNTSGSIEFVGWSSTYNGFLMQTWTNGVDYLVLVNGKPASLPAAFTVNDIVEVVVFNDALLRDTYGELITRYICVHEHNHANIFPGQAISYTSDSDFKLKSVCYPGIMKLEVWSNDVFRG